MRPVRRSHGVTLSRTRSVVVPTMRLPPPAREGVGVFQRMLTDGSRARVPRPARLCSMHRLKKKPTEISPRARQSWRTQRVADDSGEGAGGRHAVVRIREGQAAFVPGVAAHRTDVLHGTVDEGSRGKRFGARVAVTARGPCDF